MVGDSQRQATSVATCSTIASDYPFLFVYDFGGFFSIPRHSYLSRRLAIFQLRAYVFGDDRVDGNGTSGCPL